MMTNWWDIAPFDYVNDGTVEKALYDEGYLVTGPVGHDVIGALREFYNERHKFRDSGMFNSMYSRNAVYRKEVHRHIEGVMKGFLDSMFSGYKLLYSVFFLKGPQTTSDFFIHQELTFVDEFRYSPLHLWIPLIDIHKENGAVCLVEKTHHLYAPYRGMSYNNPTDEIKEVVRDYMLPIEMKAGEVLMFDPRLIHSSLPNHSTETRPAVVCVVVPEEADVIITYKGREADAMIELIRQEDDFFLTSNLFIEASRERPDTGESLGFVDYIPRQMGEEEFRLWCAEHGIPRRNLLPASVTENCEMHRNPISKRKFTNIGRYKEFLRSLIRPMRTEADKR